MWYASQYLNVYPTTRGTKILFHGVTGAIDEVTGDVGQKLANLRNSSSVIELGDPVFPQVDYLASRGHVTKLTAAAEVAEFVSYVEKLHEQNRRVSLGLVMICLSYECNLHCPYCFQNYLRDYKADTTQGNMTPEMVDKLFNRTIPASYGALANNLDLSIYGGEPFAEANRPAIERLLHYAECRGHHVSSISNGTQIKPFIPLFGTELGKVNGVQLSFDGIAKTHDVSRVPRGGGKTFDLILENALLLAETGTEVSIRINVSRDNVHTLPELEEIFKKSGLLNYRNVKPYCNAVHDVHKTGVDEDKFPEMFSPSKLSDQMQKLRIGTMVSPYDRTCGIVKRMFDQNNKVILNRTVYCMQNRPKSFLFDHLGDVYGCYEEAGYTEKKIGTVKEDGQLELNSEYEHRQGRTVASHEPCKSCSVALTCGGGCAVQAEIANGTIYSNFCDSHRELVARNIMDYVEGRLDDLPMSSKLDGLKELTPRL